MSFYVSTATFFLLHCDEWDRVVALPRHKFVTGATLLQLIIHSRIRDFPENTTQTESNENRNYHPYLGKRNNNIIYFYEVTTGMFNFTKTPMKSEQTGQYL